MTPRRELALAALGCAAAAGLALFAATRTWSVEVTARPPLPPVRAPRSGGDLLPWLPAAAIVALAGAGALVATRGTGRRLLGGLLVLAGLGLAGGGVSGPAGGWPAVCIAAGVAVAVCGALAAGRGHRWPGMGTRYERAAGQADSGPAGLWEALDRGEDPTA